MQLRDLPANELRTLFFGDLQAFLKALEKGAIEDMTILKMHMKCILQILEIRENEEINLLRRGKNAAYLPI